MRSLIDLLTHLRAQNVSLSLDGEALKCSAPAGVLTAELRGELSARKPEIIAFLQSARQPSPSMQQGIRRLDRSGPLPLSLAQQRLWFLHQLDPVSSVYNIAAALRMRGPLDINALERSLMKIVQRHETLRTHFLQVEGVPQAFIENDIDWELQVVDARQVFQREGESGLVEMASKLARGPFDLSHGPLFRAHLLMAGKNNFVILVTLHHIITDGWSMGVFVSELASLYPAYANGRNPELPPLAVEYVDFAAWQREWLESGEMVRQLPYWKQQLAGAPPVVGFPEDHRRPSAETFAGSRFKMVVPPELRRQLEQVGQHHGVTLFMTLLAAFNVLLSRYTGQEDIVVGSPSAGRNRPELNPLIGFFVNNLVLRTDLSGDPTFAALLHRVRDLTLRAYEHQDVPFDRLVQALRPERSLEHSPLFQVMFTLQNFRLEELQIEEIETEPMELQLDAAQFDLTVEIYPRNQELWVYFDYKTDLYTPETMHRIQRHYRAILESICAAPERKISEIAMLSPEEQRELLVERNRTAAKIPEGVCFHHRFDANAAATPDRVAIIAGNTTVTYRELQHRADRIAASLRQVGAGPENLVAVCMDRSADLIAALLGVAKSGAAYIPLDPAYPAGRITNIFQDAQPLAVLTTRRLLSKLPAELQSGAPQVICLDELDETAAQIEGNRAASEVRPENLAYVIFTSGSTGRPKGVQITHRALLNFLESMAKEPGIEARDVLLAVTTVSFDIAALELLLPLYVGATVAIAVKPGDPASLLEDVARVQPTIMQATPATWKLLIAAGWKGSPVLKILCGGEALDADLARSLLVRSESLWNMYGPTETTIWSAVLRVQGMDSGVVPIGHPIQNTSLYVLDRFLQPVPDGVAGELWIGGEGLARGYLNRPDLTGERFLPSPFTAGDRLYRTGDLVRYRPDGNLDFLGRLDHQIKLRGFRIELGEIENALRGHDAVADVVTILREDDGDKRLVAYIVCSGADTPAISDLKSHLRESLPEYMVPAAFVFLDALPRLPNGKLNRAALPAPEQSLASVGEGFVAPAAGLEETVAAVFRRVLAVERVGMDDNFFDLGAHSLQIVKIHAEISRTLDREVPLISFFQYPTIRSLTAFLGQSSPCAAVAAK
jgi:amino acid adenylation domain-containing protein